MKRFNLFLSLGIIFILSSISWGDIPKRINFQGILTDAGGNPLGDSTVSVVFTIYDSPGGSTTKWTETRSIITDSAGQFSIILGTTTPIPDTAFTGPDRYLGIKVESDAEMTPRQQLVSMPYAYEFDDSGPDSTVISSIFGTAFLGKATGSAGQMIGIEGKVTNSGGASFGGKFTATTLGPSLGGQTGVRGDANGTTSSPTFGVVGNASNSSSGTAYGGYFSNADAGTGVHYGVYGTASGSSSPTLYGGFFQADSGGTGDHVGSYGVGYGNSSGEVYGSFGIAQNSGSGLVAGGDFIALSSGIGATYGALGQAYGPDSTFGVYGTAFGSGPYTAIGSYGYGSNSSTGTAYGGYFEVPPSGPSRHYGVKGVAAADNTIPTAAVGCEGFAYNLSSGSTYAGYFWTSPSARGTGSRYGVYAEGNSHGGFAYGVYGNVDNDSSGFAFGVYGSTFFASPSATNYGVYGLETAGGSGAAVYASGDFAGSGAKYAVCKTSQGHRLMSVIEAPEVLFEDFGEGKLFKGKTHIELDPLFLETVTINPQNPMKVFIQLEDDCQGVFVKKFNSGFDVIERQNGTSNSSFSYRIVAKRKGYENQRLRQTDVGMEDPNLYPELWAEMEKRHQEEQAQRELENQRLEEQRLQLQKPIMPENQEE